MTKKYFVLLISIHFYVSPMMFNVSPLIVLAQHAKQESKKQRTKKHLLRILHLMPPQLWGVMFEYLGNSMHFEKTMEYDLPNPQLSLLMVGSTRQQFVLHETNLDTPHDYIKTLWDLDLPKPIAQRKGNQRNFPKVTFAGKEFTSSHQPLPRGLTCIYNPEANMSLVQCDKNDPYTQPIMVTKNGKEEYLRPFGYIGTIERLDHHHFVTVSNKDEILHLWHSKDPEKLVGQKLIRTFSTGTWKSFPNPLLLAKQLVNPPADRHFSCLSKFDENHFFTISEYGYNSVFGVCNRIKLWHKDSDEPLQTIACAGKEYEDVCVLDQNNILIQLKEQLSRKNVVERYSRRPTDFELLFRAQFHDVKKRSETLA